MPAWCSVSTRKRKSSGRAEPRGRRVVGGDLVPPRPAERVLGDRQELHVGEPHVGHVRGELGGQLAVGQPGPPRPEVHLVDGHRAGQRLPLGALGQPVGVAPGVVRLVDDRRGGGRHLRVARPSGRPCPARPRRGRRWRTCTGCRARPRDEQLPDPGAAERPHRVGPPVPEVEVADEADAARVRRPDGERGAGLALADHGPRAERVPQLLVPSLADQVQVELAERRQVPVRVVLQLRLAVDVGDLKPVTRERTRLPRAPSPRTRRGGGAPSGACCRRAAPP